MHRTIEASVESHRTDKIVQELETHPYVVGLNVLRHVSVKPPGDTLIVHVLNKGADDVLRTIRSHTSEANFSIITSEVASINDPQHQKIIDNDIDEAIWEEMETGLRHNGKLTSNYLLLMAIGGVIATVGFVSEVHNQVIAFVAASIIAPGLEPLAKIPLGIVLGKRNVVWTGIKASTVGYFLIALTSALTFFILLKFSDVKAEEFLQNKATFGLTELKLKDFLMSSAAAAASIIMYLAYRRNVIAGPLIALILIPATAAIGMSIAIGEWAFTIEFIKRLGVDMALIIAIGIILIFAKQKMVHKRKPLR